MAPRRGAADGGGAAAATRAAAAAAAVAGAMWRSGGVLPFIRLGLEALAVIGLSLEVAAACASAMLGRVTEGMGGFTRLAVTVVMGVVFFAGVLPLFAAAVFGSLTLTSVLSTTLLGLPVAVIWDVAGCVYAGRIVLRWVRLYVLPCTCHRVVRLTGDARLLRRLLAADALWEEYGAPLVPYLGQQGRILSEAPGVCAWGSLLSAAPWRVPPSQVDLAESSERLSPSRGGGSVAALRVGFDDGAERLVPAGALICPGGPLWPLGQWALKHRRAKQA
eukprot:TRINITY_DN55500_c0_g1_i1.p1 TRINITY_DN55500_c0_g1~~TRINITY_DN55500_c0_g1_i1.p1  ORF type:complete len:295 (+),score=77.39 TRINITY_DN55500_c0_g1_i1:60-887(+)